MGGADESVIDFRIGWLHDRTGRWSSVSSGIMRSLVFPTVSTVLPQCIEQQGNSGRGAGSCPYRREWRKGHKKSSILAATPPIRHLLLPTKTTRYLMFGFVYNRMYIEHHPLYSLQTTSITPQPKELGLPWLIPKAPRRQGHLRWTRPPQKGIIRHIDVPGAKTQRSIQLLFGRHLK